LCFSSLYGGRMRCCDLAFLSSTWSMRGPICYACWSSLWRLFAELRPASWLPCRCRPIIFFPFDSKSLTTCCSLKVNPRLEKGRGPSPEFLSVKYGLSLIHGRGGTFILFKSLLVETLWLGIFWEGSESYSRFLGNRVRFYLCSFL
jgi:hypothetical protein